MPPLPRSPAPDRYDRPSAGPPVLLDFLAAHAAIREHVAATPLMANAELDERYGLRFFGKHENLAPGRSFKVRGALYRLSRLSDDERAVGVVASSTGNHGIGVAWAARVVGTTATIVVPAGTPAVKTDQIVRLGAQLLTIGETLAQADAAARELASGEGRVGIRDGEDPAVMLGAGTIALEVVHERPDIEVLLVPVGGGNLIAGVARCAKALNPAIEIVGVQSASAPAVHESWRAGHVVDAKAATFAGGLATDHPGELALASILELVDDIVLVSDAELRAAMRIAAGALGQTVEGAGVAGIAALERFGSRWRGQAVATILTGGNCDVDELCVGAAADG